MIKGNKIFKAISTIDCVIISKALCTQLHRYYETRLQVYYELDEGQTSWLCSLWSIVQVSLLIINILFINICK